MGRLSACTTTCNMKYDKHYVDFFAIVYLLFGASCLNVLRGPLHFGQVVSGDCKKGLYLPSEAKCNFAVPHINVLKKIDMGYPCIVPPRIGKYTLDKLEKENQNDQEFVISFDGMKVAHGCKGKCDGDVDLWGCERPFPLNDIEKKMDEDLTAINQLKCASRYGNTIEKLQVTERTLLIMSQGCQRMSTQLMAKNALETRLQNMKLRNPDKKRLISVFTWFHLS